MKLHPRTLQVGAARAEIMSEFWRAIKQHDLTYGEAAVILGDLTTAVGRMMIRAERHPDDPEKKGDES